MQFILIYSNNNNNPDISIMVVQYINFINSINYLILSLKNLIKLNFMLKFNKRNHFHFKCEIARIIYINSYDTQIYKYKIHSQASRNFNKYNNFKLKYKQKIHHKFDSLLNRAFLLYCEILFHHDFISNAPKYENL